MKSHLKLVALVALVVSSSGLTACSSDNAEPAPEPSTGSASPSQVPTTIAPTPTPTPSPSPTPVPEPVTEVIELTPFLDDGSLAQGWTLSEDTQLSGESVPSDCSPSGHSYGENTVECGPTAFSLGACWLTEDATQVACLDEYAPVEQNLRLITLDGAGPSSTPAADNPMPIWVELEDGTLFTAVHGGAFSPPDGYYVAYIRSDSSGIYDEILEPDGDLESIFDESESQWTALVGTDGGQTVSSKKVTRVWYLAGRSLSGGSGE